MASTVYYAIKSPRQDSKRRTFAIVAKEGGKWHTLDLPELDTINKLYKAQSLTLAKAEVQVNKLLESLYQERDKDQYKFHRDNEKVFDAYWSEKYANRPLLSKQCAYNDYRRALKALGEHLSLISSSQDAIQKQINALFGKFPTKHRRCVKDLNALLKYAGRHFRLWAEKKRGRRIKYLTMVELEKAITKIQAGAKEIKNPTEVFQLFVRASFATGARTGELLSLAPSDIHSTWVHIHEQLDRELVKRDTKTGKTRRTIVIPQYHKDLVEFSKLPKGTKEWLRNKKNASELKKACEAAGLPEEKWITAHQLRHSYAMHLLSRGVDARTVADSIGDTLATFYDHYKDYIIDDDSLNRAAALLKPKSTKKAVK